MRTSSHYTHPAVGTTAVEDQALFLLDRAPLDLSWEQWGYCKIQDADELGTIGIRLGGAWLEKGLSYAIARMVVTVDSGAVVPAMKPE